MPTSSVAVVLFLKSGVEGAGSLLAGYIWNARLWGGLACYVAVIVSFVAAFKRGGALTVLYPVYASPFVVAAVLAWRVYGTTIHWPNVVGMLLLVLGMYLLGR